MPSSTRAIPYENVRLEVPLRGRYHEAVAHYERLVPAADTSGLADATWDEVLERARRDAPYDFMIYWRLDVTALLRAAGDPWLCTEYLMGNHTIAQRMFRRNPAAMLSAPLRTVIYAGPGDVTWLAIDRPSSRFASYRDPAITAVGYELDDKLAALLEALGAPVPPELQRP